jgi:hypothetical protein
MTAVFIKDIENFLHNLVSSTEAEIVAYATPAIKFIEANGGTAILALAEGVLAGAVAGTPWATLAASLVTQAEAAGIQLAEGAASVVLNYAQSNMQVSGTATGAAVVTASVASAA